MNGTQTPDRLECRPSALEAERADIIADLERYLALMTSDTTTPIVQEIAAVLADERLCHLHELDTADDLREITESPRKGTRP